MVFCISSKTKFIMESGDFQKQLWIGWFDLDLISVEVIFEFLELNSILVTNYVALSKDFDCSANQICPLKPLK